MRSLDQKSKTANRQTSLFSLKLAPQAEILGFDRTLDVYMHISTTVRYGKVDFTSEVWSNFSNHLKQYSGRLSGLLTNISIESVDNKIN